MNKLLSFFFIYSISFCIQLNLTNAEPLRGERVLPVKDNNYRYVAHIAYKDKESPSTNRLIYTCSGTIITRRHVLTSDHCLTKTGAEITETLVLAGSNDLVKCTKYRPIFWMTYIDYHEQITNGAKKLKLQADTDLAVIELSEKVDETITPATISLKPVEQFEGALAEIVGWGLIKDNELNKHLRHAFVTVMSPETCGSKVSEKIKRLQKVHARNICTAANPPVTLSCGDSGGPVVYNNKVIAVNRGTCPLEVEEPERFNMHLYLMYYKHFIDYVTEDEAVTYDSV